ncbi:cytochrome c biogenesis protein DipZ [Capillimicrobium parvum]|uniref:Protein DipZ n=1 Tax=Capillimicrobium parvum TaxID=2884022 RepID=A0A9E7BYP2_9ACTN|nr:cytochrome c biogenesis protein DipZ [Capillimicrobium parvum]UGS33702.1 Protein DipZ [Capillimicrobium parvum]
MVLLVAFAFLAGAATALSPCVLPVLPVALAAGVTGGRRRPLGVVVGLAAAFAFATVALVYAIDALGLPDDLVRTLAIAVLLGFGVVLMVPPLAARVEAAIGRIVPSPEGGAHAEGGFGSGVIVGAGLGLVYAPCAGPILAGVITVSAAQPFTAGRLAVALAYAAGSAVVLYVLMLGGRRLTRRLARRSGALQMGAGAVMVVVAVLMLADYDVRFQNAIADDLPAFVVNPTRSLESSRAVHDRLADLHPARRGIGTAAAHPSALTRAGGIHGKVLPVLGTAPEFLGTQRWFNTPGDRPLTLRELRGRVVLVDFWTYTCINCIRTLPFLKAWDARYRSEGLTIVGVHTPEFPFERDAGNVRDAIGRNGLRYPVAQDNEYATWNAYGNEYWPATYLIDARGRVRYVHFGEGDDDQTEQAIRDLLAEAGDRPGAHAPPVKAEGVSRQITTPESYLGSARFASGRLTDGVQDFAEAAAGPAPNGIAYDGTWEIAPEAATAVRDAKLSLDFGAQRVFLVLGSEDRRPRPVRVLLDGRPIPPGLAGPDVHGGAAIVDRQRLYRLVDLPRAGHHVLTLEVAPGVSGYAFTFG